MEQLKTPPEEQTLIVERALAELREVLGRMGAEESPAVKRTVQDDKPLFYERFREKIQLGLN